ncbi:MAG: hypothetical protein WCS31_09280 [Verrucomicrobiae bacterium]
MKKNFSAKAAAACSSAQFNEMENANPENKKLWTSGNTEEGYIAQKGTCWRLRAASVEKTVVFENGKLLMKSFLNTVSGNEMVESNVISDEFFLTVGDNAERISGSIGGWRIIDSKVTTLKQGELQLEIILESDELRVTKSYVVYPGTSIIREWVTIKNRRTTPVAIIDPGFLNFTANAGKPQSLDFNWITGGGHHPATWKLVTESLTPGKVRAFDSAEVFPLQVLTEEDKKKAFPGKGVEARILLNDKQVWPEESWAFAKGATIQIPFDFKLEVKSGDRLAFVVRGLEVNAGGLKDATCFDPTITYDNGESHVASKEFSGEQGHGGWRYQYMEGGVYKDLAYNPEIEQWRNPAVFAQDDKQARYNYKGPCIGGPFQNHDDSGWVTPGQDHAVARVWIASKENEIRVSGELWNEGNGYYYAWKGWKQYQDRPGTENYAPWYALYNRDTKDGIIVGWDYFGHWKSSFTPSPSGDITVQLKVGGYNHVLAPGESIETPKAFTGLYRDDLDNAGNECLNWQYRYLWDYTRDGWFPAIRMSGWWFKGTSLRGSSRTAGWYGENPDYRSNFLKVFTHADTMRRVGADVYHRDWGWWDMAGEWNGPDFRGMNNYLEKHEMRLLIYAFIYLAHKDSRVAREHPDWLIDHPECGLVGSVLDMAKPEVVEFMKGVLDKFAENWGAFEWRNDDKHQIISSNDAASSKLAQDQGFRRVLSEFLDEHHDCAFQAVNGGGYYGGYDYVRYSSSFSFSDGAVGILRNYYASLLFPPDKTSDIPDRYQPDMFDKSTWRGLLCFNFDMTGDTWDSEKLEGVRELIDIYHYLLKHGVVGRWVQVYRPNISGDDPIMYLQRLSQDALRGIIIPKRPAPGPVTIQPKGLLADGKYIVSFHESEELTTRTGADLMSKGIFIEQMIPGELIYLNLPLHPGSKLDKEPPTSPPSAVKQLAENMGYPGVEMKWEPGTDNNWVSSYEIYRNGKLIDKVAKGAYYFDHSVGADLASNYEVRTVDGAGNVSPKTKVGGTEATPSRIIDDTAKDLRYSGEWQHEKGIFPAYEGTLSWSNRKGDSVELSVEGKSVLWFSKHGADCGKASVGIDGADKEIVDTYSADDIFGVCVYKKALEPGRHVLSITVLGEHGQHPNMDAAAAKESRVYIDGFRIEK